MLMNHEGIFCKNVLQLEKGLPHAQVFFHMIPTIFITLTNLLVWS
jgi:hypothetical protein